jgi:hypothetical protein
MLIGTLSRELLMHWLSGAEGKIVKPPGAVNNLGAGNPTNESGGYCHSSASPTFAAKPLQIKALSSMELDRLQSLACEQFTTWIYSRIPQDSN